MVKKILMPNAMICKILMQLDWVMGCLRLNLKK